MKELAHLGQVFGSPEVFVAVGSRDLQPVGLKLGGCGLGSQSHRCAFVVRPAELTNVVLPSRFLFQQVVDFVIQVADAVLTQRGILDVRDFLDQLANDLLSPLLALLDGGRLLRVAGSLLPDLGVE